MGDNITYICKRTVVSTKAVQPGKFCRLSVLDRVMEQKHIRAVFYYECPGGEGREGSGETIKKLRESLAEMLTCFPEVTGRLVRDQEDGGQWMIKCNDAGVRMVEASAKGSVHEWLKCVDRDKERMLVHWEDMYHKPYYWATFYVQLTEFEEGGLAVGLSCTHLLADPICASMFIRAWAKTTLDRNMNGPPVSHALPPRQPGNKDPTHNPYTRLINHYKSIIERTNSVSSTENHATIALLFSDHMVRACMNMARTNTSEPDPPSPSPFEALSALFWVSLSKVKGVQDGLTDMSICLDMRNVLGLDKGFFGNCMIYNKVQAATESLSQHKLAGAARAISDAVGEMSNEGIMDLIEWLQCNDLRSPQKMNGCDLVCASLEGVDSYSAMFEEGFGPIHVSYYVEPVIGEGQVLILPAPPNEGAMSRVVMVTLPKDEVVKLVEDKFVLSFSPNILMGMNK